MENWKEKLKSVRVKLFLTLTIAVIIIIIFLILLNNVVLETFYLYSKKVALKSVYEQVNSYYNNPTIDIDISLELEKIAINNNFDILIKTDKNMNIYTSNKDFISTLGEMNSITYDNNYNKNDVLYSDSKMLIRKMSDRNNGLKFILLSSTLDNGYLLYIRIPIASIEESVKISNKFLYLIGGFTIIIAGIMVSFISKRFTEPISELNDIAKKMSRLDFSKKYRTTDTRDEINTLRN